MSDPAVEAARRVLDEWVNDTWNASRDFVAEAAAREALAPLRELHKPVQAVHSWGEPERLVPRCPECLGRAGVHPCGCWADVDIQFACSTCRYRSGRHEDWPCPTAKLIYTTEELQ